MRLAQPRSNFWGLGWMSQVASRHTRADETWWHLRPKRKRTGPDHTTYPLRTERRARARGLLHDDEEPSVRECPPTKQARLAPRWVEPH